MGSRLIYDLAVGLGEAGYRACRFDFRGVGRSQGRFDDGRGEADDVAAVRRFLGPGILLGHSFGGAVALRAARDPPKALVVMGTPLAPRASALAPLEDAARVRCPALVIVGEGDEHVPVADAARLAEALDARLEVVPGGGHFLEPDANPQVLRRVLSFLRKA